MSAPIPISAVSPHSNPRDPRSQLAPRIPPHPDARASASSRIHAAPPLPLSPSPPSPPPPSSRPPPARVPLHSHARNPAAGSPALPYPPYSTPSSKPSPPPPRPPPPKPSPTPHGPSPTVKLASRPSYRKPCSPPSSTRTPNGSLRSVLRDAGILKLTLLPAAAPPSRKKASLRPHGLGQNQSPRTSNGPAGPKALRRGTPNRHRPPRARLTLLFLSSRTRISVFHFRI